MLSSKSHNFFWLMIHKRKIEYMGKAIMHMFIQSIRFFIFTVFIMFITAYIFAYKRPDLFNKKAILTSQEKQHNKILSKRFLRLTIIAIIINIIVAIIFGFTYKNLFLFIFIPIFYEIYFIYKTYGT